MKDQEFLCFCCFNCPKDKRNLKEVNTKDKDIYREFTGNEIEVESAKICVSCKESLINSLEFLNLCKTTYQKIIEQQNEIKISEICSEDIIFAPEPLDDIQFDQEDDIPISCIKQQLDEVNIFKKIN